MVVYDISIKNIGGRRIELSKYEGKVILIVNVASQCGFTPQYKNLQELHHKYNSKGLFILAFPCNDFGEQEPSSSNKIKEFCDRKYGVKFDVFEKIKIRGQNPHPLYIYLETMLFPVARSNGIKGKVFQWFTNVMFWLKEGRFPRNGEVQWNFHKFIIGKNGSLAGHFPSDCDPFEPQIIACIERELEKKIN